jgi:hypothetical protein
MPGQGAAMGEDGRPEVRHKLCKIALERASCNVQFVTFRGKKALRRTAPGVRSLRGSQHLPSGFESLSTALETSSEGIRGVANRRAWYSHVRL